MRTPTATELLGQRIRHARVNRGWRQADLAAAMTDAGRDMTHQAVGLMERGGRAMPIGDVVVVAQALGVRLAWLVEPLETPQRDGSALESFRASLTGQGTVAQELQRIGREAMESAQAPRGEFAELVNRVARQDSQLQEIAQQVAKMAELFLDQGGKS